MIDLLFTTIDVIVIKNSAPYLVYDLVILRCRVYVGVEMVLIPLTVTGLQELVYLASVSGRITTLVYLTALLDLVLAFTKLIDKVQLDLVHGLKVLSIDTVSSASLIQ